LKSTDSPLRRNALVAFICIALMLNAANFTVLALALEAAWGAATARRLSLSSRHAARRGECSR
jgi:NADH:ubiquinone oxidoreductase subunit K